VFGLQRFGVGHGGGGGGKLRSDDFGAAANNAACFWNLPVGA